MTYNELFQGDMDALKIIRASLETAAEGGDALACKKVASAAFYLLMTTIPDAIKGMAENEKDQQPAEHEGCSCGWFFPAEIDLALLGEQPLPRGQQIIIEMHFNCPECGKLFHLHMKQVKEGETYVC